MRESQASAKNLRVSPLSPRKRALFGCAAGLGVLLITAVVWQGAEIAYRFNARIPLFGGQVFKSDLQPHAGAGSPDESAHASGRDAFLSRTLALFALSESDILFYEPRPGASSGLYTINSLGFRDREYSLVPDEDVFRIVVLGDSIMWGHGLPLEVTFAKKLEDLLNERFNERFAQRVNQGLEQPSSERRPKRFEVLNFGVSGYSTQQEVEFYKRKASLYAPDLVIVGYCLNDSIESSAEGDAMRQMYYDIWQKSYLYDEIRLSVNVFLWENFNRPFDRYETKIDLRKEFRQLTEYTDGRRNMLLVFPVFQDFSRYKFAHEHKKVANALEGLNYEFVDLMAAYRSYRPENLRQNDFDTLHPNAFGMRLAAAVAFRVLLERDLIHGERADFRAVAN